MAEQRHPGKRWPPAASRPGVSRVIAVVVTAAVALAAWLAGRDRPVPPWLENRLLPALAWVVLALAAVLLIDWVRRRRRSRRGASAPGRD